MRTALVPVAALLLCGCGGGAGPSPSQSAAVRQPGHSAAASATAGTDPCAPPAMVGTVPPVLPAAFPTAIAFAPDGRLFYTERGGDVRVYQGGASKVFATVQTVTTEPGGGYSERGLLGLALSPSFTQDRLVYAFFSNTDYSHQQVIRWRDCAGTGTNAQVIITLPSGADCCHKGGRLAFGTDGKLYVTLGDEHDAAAAQQPGDVRGKILRYNPDGSIPGDNPWGGANPVWAYGLRNPFGLAFSPTGQLAVTSNGPSGDAGSPRTGYDLLFLSVQRGAGYMWPICYGYAHPLQGSCPSDQHGPDWSSETSTVVPTGAAWIDDAGPMGLASHLVFATFSGGLKVVTPGSPYASVAQGDSRCLLDVTESPGHSVYCSDSHGIYHIG